MKLLVPGQDAKSIGEAILAIAPLTVAALVLTIYPETARRELEDINPEDREGS